MKKYITISKNNFDGGKCQICKKYHHEIHQIWNEKIKHDLCDNAELFICKECLKQIICAFIDEN